MDCSAVDLYRSCSELVMEIDDCWAVSRCRKVPRGPCCGKLGAISNAADCSNIAFRRSFMSSPPTSAFTVLCSILTATWGWVATSAKSRCTSALISHIATGVWTPKRKSRCSHLPSRVLLSTLAPQSCVTSLRTTETRPLATSLLGEGTYWLQQRGKNHPYHRNDEFRWRRRWVMRLRGRRENSRHPAAGRRRKFTWVGEFLPAPHRIASPSILSSKANKSFQEINFPKQPHSELVWIKRRTGEG
jgi:hypothetical protein